MHSLDTLPWWLTEILRLGWQGQVQYQRNLCPYGTRPQSVRLWHLVLFICALSLVMTYESGSPVSPCSAVSFYQIMPTVRIRTRLVTKNFLNIQKKEVLVILPNNTSKTNNLLISDRLFKITIAGFMQPVSCKFTTMPECQESGYSDHPCHCESVTLTLEPYFLIWSFLPYRLPSSCQSTCSVVFFWLGSSSSFLVFFGWQVSDLKNGAEKRKISKLKGQSLIGNLLV